jgi:hypothetical protein
MTARRERFGNLSANAYVMRLIDIWLDAPGGLEFRGEGRKRMS